MTDAIQGLVSAAKNSKFSTISSNLSDEGELRAVCGGGGGGGGGVTPIVDKVVGCHPPYKFYIYRTYLKLLRMLHHVYYYGPNK